MTNELLASRLPRMELHLSVVVVAATPTTTAAKQAIYLPSSLRTSSDHSRTCLHSSAHKQTVRQCAAQLVTVSRFESELTLSSEVCSADSSRGCIITPKAYDLFVFPSSAPSLLSSSPFPFSPPRIVSAASASKLVRTEPEIENWPTKQRANN